VESWMRENHLTIEIKIFQSSLGSTTARLHFCE